MRFNTMLNKVSSYIINTLIKVKILPSWFILIFDLLLVELVSLGSLIFLKLISHSSYKDLLLYYLLFNLIVFFIVFLLFKTSRSIVRYSSYDDVLKIINSVLSSFFILSISNYFLNTIYNIHFISTFFIAINCFLILLVLITFRIFVKYFFQLIKTIKKLILQIMQILHAQYYCPFFEISLLQRLEMNERSILLSDIKIQISFLYKITIN